MRLPYHRLTSDGNDHFLGVGVGGGFVIGRGVGGGVSGFDETGGSDWGRKSLAFIYFVLYMLQGCSAGLHTNLLLGGGGFFGIVNRCAQNRQHENHTLIGGLGPQKNNGPEIGSGGLWLASNSGLPGFKARFWQVADYPTLVFKIA